MLEASLLRKPKKDKRRTPAVHFVFSSPARPSMCAPALNAILLMAISTFVRLWTVAQRFVVPEPGPSFVASPLVWFFREFPPSAGTLRGASACPSPRSVLSHHFLCLFACLALSFLLVDQLSFPSTFLRAARESPARASHSPSTPKTLACLSRSSCFSASFLPRRPRPPIARHAPRGVSLCTSQRSLPNNEPPLTPSRPLNRKARLAPTAPMPPGDVSAPLRAAASPPPGRPRTVTPNDGKAEAASEDVAEYE